jgi:VWFA-related protein
MPSAALHPRALCTLALSAISSVALAQAPSPDITVNTNLVVVPTLVLSTNGDITHLLTASDFKLLDNGVTQKVTLQQQEQQPLAIVVLLQTGGAASRQFGYFANLPTMLQYVTGSSTYYVALVTFDSQPEYEWDFTPRITDFAHDLSHPESGNNGAAILDAVDHAITLLSTQPPGRRRIILLISQPQDDGSRTKAEDVIRHLGEQNVTLYSLTFSPEKTWLKDQFTKPRQGEKPYHLSNDQPAVLYTFDVLTPLMEAVNAMRTNAPKEIATLSDGETLSFNNRHDFEQQLSEIANRIPNRYMLTFTPSSKQSGFHTLRVEVPGNPGLTIAARTSYWLTAAP